MSESFVDIAIPDKSGFTGLYVSPKTPARGAILLVQEIFGINENMRLTARDYAAKGFHVLVPDLFWRTEARLDLNPGNAADREKAMGLNQAFDDAKGLSDLTAAAKTLKQLASTESVASVGYCLGGRMSFALGSTGAVSAAVAYYGVALQKYFEGPHHARTLVHVAQQDTLCPPPAQLAIVEYAQRFDNVSVSLHAGVGHAFSRIGSPAHVPAIAEVAQAQTDAFLVAQG